MLLDKAGAVEGLDALVLVHQDTEIADSGFADAVRAALRDPDVAIVGCAGAVGVRSIAWWQGEVTWASMTHRYEEYGGGEFPAPTWDPDRVPNGAAPGEVDSVDGLVLVLSPWAVRNLRFDESLGTLHGYDFDICMQARVAGRKVVTADFRAIHHHSLELVNDPEAWTEAYTRLARKWKGQIPGGSRSAEELRTEAEAACARAVAASHQYRAQAVKRQLDRANEELARARADVAAVRSEADATAARLREVLGSSSWRLTEPLRALRRRSRR